MSAEAASSASERRLCRGDISRYANYLSAVGQCCPASRRWSVGRGAPEPRESIPPTSHSLSPDLIGGQGTSGGPFPLTRLTVDQMGVTDPSRPPIKSGDRSWRFVRPQDGLWDSFMRPRLRGADFGSSRSTSGCLCALTGWLTGGGYPLCFQHLPPRSSRGQALKGERFACRSLRSLLIAGARRGLQLGFSRRWILDPLMVHA